MAVASSRILVPAARIADRARHLTALRLLPFLFTLYLANYLDRTSVAYAAIGMTRELGFERPLDGAGVFFISYVALQIPGALLVERWSARRNHDQLIGRGLMTALTALVHTPSELYVARFLLGRRRGRILSGVIVYLSHWFVCEDRAKVTSNFMSAIPLSFVIAALFAGLILGQVGWASPAGAGFLFFLKGCPPFCWVPSRSFI